MTLSRRTLLAQAGATAAVTSLPAWARVASATADAKAMAVLDGIAEDYMRLAPEAATGLGVDTGKRAALRALSSDPSPAGVARTAAWTKGAIAKLEALDRTGLSAATRTHVDVALTAYRNARDGLAFGFGDVSIGGWRNGPYVVAQNMGVFLDTPKFLDANQKVETRPDAEAYLARLGRMAAMLDGETARLKAARGRGIVAPDFILDKTLAAARMTLAEAPAQAIEVTSLAKRTKAIPGDWAQRAEAIVARQTRPALARQIAELEAHRRLADSRAGMWKFAEGPAYYQWALGAATTTRLTPDEVHAMGQAQLKDLYGQMEPILASLGMTQGSVGARMRALSRDPRFTFAAGDAGRAQILQFIEGRIADIRSRMPRAFNTLVRGNVEVKRIAPAEELGAPGAYGGAGTIDGSVPGRFWINLRDPASHTKFSLPTLAYHEAIPGHVWEGEYTNQLPLIRALMSFSAFSEGWGLYGEQLGDELGVYEGDPAGKLGYLNSMAFRAARLVVDSGIHAKRWDRDKAREWFAEATGDTVDGVTSEVDRYCVWPGQACAYKVGHSEINRQRERARTALGSRYDFKAYNDLVVQGGNRPLVVLEQDVSRYIAAQKA